MTPMSLYLILALSRTHPKNTYTYGNHPHCAFYSLHLHFTFQQYSQIKRRVLGIGEACQQCFRALPLCSGLNECRSETLN
jgi:hypothetical protein